MEHKKLFEWSGKRDDLVDMVRFFERWEHSVGSFEYEQSHGTTTIISRTKPFIITEHCRIIINGDDVMIMSPDEWDVMCDIFGHLPRSIKCHTYDDNSVDICKWVVNVTDGRLYVQSISKPHTGRMVLSIYETEDNKLWGTANIYNNEWLSYNGTHFFSKANPA